MNRIVLFLFVLLVGLPSPAWAGQTATYRNPDTGGSTRIDVADNGDTRFESTELAWHLLFVDGVSYVVYPPVAGSRVVRLADIHRVIEEQRIDPPALAIVNMRVVEQAEAAVGPYRGRAYFLEMPEGMPSRPQLVISPDPALAPIGAAWLRQIDFAIARFRLRSAPVPPTIQRFRDIIASGTPILFGGHRLESVETLTIARERFELPGPPLSLDEVRAIMASL